jgi:hypothetical protein
LPGDPARRPRLGRRRARGARRREESGATPWAAAGGPLRRFAGNRETAARLRAAEAGLEGERRDALRARLAALDAELTERDDPETIARLLAHEDELLALHRSAREADSR